MFLDLILIGIGALLVYVGAVGSYDTLLTALKGQATKPSAGAGQ